MDARLNHLVSFSAAFFAVFLAGPRSQAAEGKEAGLDTVLPAGIDISKLDDYERKVFFRVLNHESSACGKGHSLIHSLKQDPGCKRSLHAAKYTAKLVDSGYTESEVSEELQKRYRGPVAKTIEVSRAPRRGPGDAPVTIVEFVDYECPHCRDAQSFLQQVLEAYPRQVRLFFKQFPLGGHTMARTAAEAAMAAHKQGKFWPYNDKVWPKSDVLTAAVLEQIAKDVGLDVPRWRTDMASDAIKNWVSQDKADGVNMGINSTPSIYINGRRYTGRHDLESMSDWIDEELGK
jgi:protein-disulfide isomerase